MTVSGVVRASSEVEVYYRSVVDPVRYAGSIIRMCYRERPAWHVDTGVVFCRRSDFDAIGGYNERRFFAEDVQLLIDLIRVGRKSGQRLATGTKAKAVFSTRKFDKYGDWHYFTAPFRLPWNFLLGPSATNRFAQRYWYEDR